MLSLGIIWNPAFHYKDNIVNDMNNSVNIIDYFDISFYDLFQNFMYELYDDQEKWKTEKKYNSMKQDNGSANKLRIVIFEFDEKRVEYHIYKKKNVYSDLNDLKVYIRNKYGNMIDNYVFDNVFHCTDDIMEFKKSYGIVQKYIRILLLDKLNMVLKKEETKKYVK